MDLTVLTTGDFWLHAVLIAWATGMTVLFLDERRANKRLEHANKLLERIAWPEEKGDDLSEV